MTYEVFQITNLNVDCSQCVTVYSGPVIEFGLKKIRLLES